MIRKHTNKPSLRKQLSHRFESIHKKAIKESAMDKLFDEFINEIDFELIKGLIPSDLDYVVKHALDDMLSDDEIIEHIRENTYSLLEDNNIIIDYCISLMKKYLKNEKEEYKLNNYKNKKEMEKDFKNNYEHEFELLNALEEHSLNGDSIMDIIETYGDTSVLIDWMRDDVIDDMASSMSLEDQIDALGLRQLEGQDLADTLDSLDIVSMDRLYQAFKEITENDEYWYNRKIELEDDEDSDMDESVSRRQHLRRIAERRNHLKRSNKY